MIVAGEKQCNGLARVWAGTGRQEVLGGRMQAPGSSDPGHYEGPCSLKQHLGITFKNQCLFNIFAFELHPARIYIDTHP